MIKIKGRCLLLAIGPSGIKINFEWSYQPCIVTLSQDERSNSDEYSGFDHGEKSYSFVGRSIFHPAFSLDPFLMQSLPINPHNSNSLA